LALDPLHAIFRAIASICLPSALLRTDTCPFLNGFIDTVFIYREGDSDRQTQKTLDIANGQARTLIDSVHHHAYVVD
jgi:hypothetical protein